MPAPRRSRSRHTAAAAARPAAAPTDLPPGVPAAAVEAAGRAITPETLEAPIVFLADDLLEGRGPAGRGDRLTQL